MPEPNTTQDNVPWYRRKAERPKERRTFNIFAEHIDRLTEGKYKNHSSGFVRYLMDCYDKIRIPTDSGFKAWTKNGEKFE